MMIKMYLMSFKTNIIGAPPTLPHQHALLLMESIVRKIKTLLLAMIFCNSVTITTTTTKKKSTNWGYDESITDIETTPHPLSPIFARQAILSFPQIFSLDFFLIPPQIFLISLCTLLKSVNLLFPSLSPGFFQPRLPYHWPVEDKIEPKSVFFCFHKSAGKKLSQHKTKTFKRLFDA